MKNLWFAVAFVEFVILLSIFVPRIISSMSKKSTESGGENKGKKKGNEGRKGMIINLEFVIRGLAGMGGPVTIFKIHESNGNIFYAGVYNHDHYLSEGSSIEFWPSSETIAEKDVPKIEQADDGTRSSWQEKIKYYWLAKYRVIPDESEISAIETMAEKIAHEDKLQN